MANKRISDLTVATNIVSGDLFEITEIAGPTSKAVEFSLLKSKVQFVDEISITAAATLTIDRAHVCLGTSADYNATLPPVSGNAGRIVSLRIAAGCTRWITLKGDGSETIDGSNTRRMWAHESATLLCNGTEWVKIGGRTIPIHVKQYRSASFGILTLGWFSLPCTGAAPIDNTLGLAVPAANLSSGFPRILRAGRYTSIAFCSAGAFPVGASLAVGAMNNPSGGSVYTPEDGNWGFFVSDLNGALYANAAGVLDCTVGDEIVLTTYNSDTTTRNINTGSSTRPAIAVLEQPTW